MSCEKLGSLVLCISGGLDSYGMFIYFLKKYLNIPGYYNAIEPSDVVRTIRDRCNSFTLLHVSLEQPYAEKEKQIIDELYPKELVKHVDIKGWIGDNINEDNFIIPARNFVIANIAANFGNEIWFAGIADENHVQMLDKNVEIFEQLSKVLTKGTGRPIEVTSPFFPITGEAWNKVDILEFLDREHNTDYHHTTSCYHPTLLRCGECFVCAKRWMAETLLKYKYLYDPVIQYNFPEFTTPIYPLSNKHIKRFVYEYFNAYCHKDFTHYHIERILRDSITLLQHIYDPDIVSFKKQEPVKLIDKLKKKDK